MSNNPVKQNKDTYIKIIDVSDRSNYTEYSKMKISNNNYSKLKNILEKIEAIVISDCNGYTVNSSELTKTFLVPFYWTKYNSSNISNYNLIMVCNGISRLSISDKRFIEKLFGLDTKEEEVIWYDQKDTLKWTNFSSIRAILYYNKDGEKKYFMHSNFSRLSNQQEVAIKNGECQIFIDTTTYNRK